jgi:hypothetical protein
VTQSALAVDVVVGVVDELTAVGVESVVAVLDPIRHEQAELTLETSPLQLPAYVGRAIVAAWVLRNCLQNADAADEEPRRARPQLSPL